MSGPVQLVAQVDERYLEQLQVGQPASVLADGFPQSRFTARVQLISPLVDAQRGAVEVKFSLPEAPPSFLREDMTLSLEVETARRDSALVVPVAALNGDVVFIARDGRVEERKVRVGLRTLEAAEVLEGLTQGDIVLTGPSPNTGNRFRATLAETPAAASTKLQGKNPGAIQSKGTREDAGSAMSNAMGR